MVKDLVSLFVFVLVIVLIITMGNSVVEEEGHKTMMMHKSPQHIRPEWYFFLFVYAIIRMIPSKGLGLLIFILVLGSWIMRPLMRSSSSMNHSLLLLLFVVTMVILTFLGSRLADSPYLSVALASTVLLELSLLLQVVL